MRSHRSSQLQTAPQPIGEGASARVDESRELLCGIWLADAEGRATYVSPVVERLLGFGVAEMRGEGWMRILDPATRDEIGAAWRACVAEGGEWDREYDVYGQDGRPRRMRSQAVAVRDGAGRITAWAGSFVDLTAARQRSDEQREQSERLEKRVAQRTALLGLLHDVAGAANSAQSIEEAFTFALRRTGETFGWCYGQAFLLSNGSLRLLDSCYEARAGRYDAVREASRRRPLERGVGLPGRVWAEGRALSTSEAARDLMERGIAAAPAEWRLAAAFPVTVGTQVVAVIEFFSDVAVEAPERAFATMDSVGAALGRVVERMQAERALRESQHLIQTMSDTSPTLQYIFDLSEGRHVYVNRQFTNFFGLAPDWLPAGGTPLFPTEVHPDDRERFGAILERELACDRGGDPLVWQVRVQDGRGEWRWLRSWSVVFERGCDARPRRILGVSIDVTHEQESEEKLRQSERLASIGTLAAGIAHEINNPLASILMTAQYVMRTPPTPETLRELMVGVVEDTKRCARIVKSVQQFARKERHEHGPQEVNEIVYAAEELTIPLFKRYGIQLVRRLSSGLPEVVGNEAEIEQVLIDLLTNAVQASQPGKTVYVSTERVGRWVRIAVTDEGAGMSPEVQRRAFDPFYTTHARDGGTGLGLSIAHGIVSDHRGMIEIESAAGRGTTVTVSLPATRSEGSAA